MWEKFHDNKIQIKCQNMLNILLNVLSAMEKTRLYYHKREQKHTV